MKANQPIATAPARPRSRVWLEVDLGALRNNYARVRQAVAPCEVMPVLKANAYGIGVAQVATALAAVGARRFGVAELNEALIIAATGRQAQILGAVLAEEIGPALEAGVILPIADLAGARAISREAVRQKRTALGHILIDSGMGRLGLPIRDCAGEIAEIARLPGLRLQGLYSHFPVANHPENDFTRRQIDRFAELLAALQARKIEFEQVHIANSDGINNFPAAARPPFNLVRSGINLYGVFDMAGVRAYQLQPALTLKSRVAQVRRLPAGMALGYGHTYRLPRETLVGTISAGYADGVPVALSNRGYVLVHDQPCPILGRVSMDYCTISLESAPQTASGDEAIFLGGSEPGAITVQDWAHLKGSNTYDIICSFGGRVERRYVET